MVIGTRRDGTFRPIVVVGLGGLFVEHFADVAFGLAPVTREQARAMLRSLRAWPLLTISFMSTIRRRGLLPPWAPVTGSSTLPFRP